jgi:hypothetical protein
MMGSRKTVFFRVSEVIATGATPRHSFLVVMVTIVILANLYWLSLWKQEYVPTLNIANPVKRTGVLSPGEWKKASSAKLHRRTPLPKKYEAVAGLQCHDHGGPTDSLAAEEMVYWRDIPKDATFASPFRSTTSSLARNQYLTFEPDQAGWNNVRMAMETAVTLALAMGRILVLPPEQEMHLLYDKSHPKKTFSFKDFFHLDAVQAENAGLEIWTFEQFLEREAMQGGLVQMTTGQISFPPDNRTNWDGLLRSTDEAKILWSWVRNVTIHLPWSGSQCVAAFPSTSGAAGVERLEQTIQSVLANDESLPGGQGTQKWKQRVNSYRNNPTPTNASTALRLAEMLANRQELCIYDETLQQAKILHVKGEAQSSYRLLLHFYAFLFFEDWRHDLWVKRFVRDHLRYIDEIQCAAARVVQALRERARHHRGENATNSGFDSFHIRRGDFQAQYKTAEMSAKVMYEQNSRRFLAEQRTVFVATDEKDDAFFGPLREHYHLYMLKDFKDLVSNVNPNYYGMVRVWVHSLYAVTLALSGNLTDSDCSRFFNILFFIGS